MATIVLGCDDNGANDAEYQSTVASILEKAGNTVEKCDIEPNAFASYSDGSNGKDPNGKIGIYLIAAGTYSIADATYGTSKFKYNYFGIRPECSPNWDCSDFDTKPIGADADCPASLCAKIAGNSFKKINEIVKEKSMVVTGKDATEMGNNLVKAMGGKTSDSGEGDNGSTAKEAIQKLLTHWDGEAECYIRGKDMYINKIKEPESDYFLILEEGVNIIRDSLQITDVNPNTVNHLIVKWTEGTITFKDEELIKRFGEIKSEVEAVKKIVKTETVTEKVDTASTDTASTDDSSSEDSSSEDTSSDSSSTEDTTTETTTTKTVVEEQPIDNYEDALKFANTEWNKIKRDNGHTIECQVRGSNKWQVGEWVKVVIPSFDENGYMYTTRVSQSNDGGDWNCNVALADYPPGWGKEELESSEDSEEDTEDTETTDADSDSDSDAATE